MQTWPCLLSHLCFPLCHCALGILWLQISSNRNSLFDVHNCGGHTAFITRTAWATNSCITYCRILHLLVKMAKVHSTTTVMAAVCVQSASGIVLNNMFGKSKCLTTNKHHHPRWFIVPGRGWSGDSSMSQSFLPEGLFVKIVAFGLLPYELTLI